MINKANITLLLAFAVTFGAGAVIGTARHSGQGRDDEKHPRGGSVLKRELDLTEEQHEQMRQIWSQLMSGGQQQGRNGWERRRELQKERDEAVVALLTPEQKQKYDELNRQYEQKSAELNETRRKAFQEAVERTRKILTPEQAAKYDQFLKRRGRGGVPRPFGNGSNAATQPAEGAEGKE